MRCRSRHEARAQRVCPLRPAIDLSTLCGRFVIENESKEHHNRVLAILDIKECVTGMWRTGFRDMRLPGRIVVGRTTNTPGIHDSCSIREAYEVRPMAMAKNNDPLIDWPQTS